MSTTRRRFVQVAGAATMAGLAGCGAQGAVTTATPDRDPEPATPAPTATPTAAPVADVVEVAMTTDERGSYFQPKGLLVDPGTTVRFVNEQGVHTATAYHPDNGDLPLRVPEGATPFDSGVVTDAGATYEVTVQTPGVWDFVCLPHESLGMVGRLVVGEPGDGPGTTEPADLPPMAREKVPSVEAILAEGAVDGP